MKLYAQCALVAVAGLSLAGCTPDWATGNSTPFILEIANITNSEGELPILSDVETEAGEAVTVVNDEARVTVNAFRKNNTPTLNTSPVEHIYLERYEVRYFRTDGRNTEGVDVPFRITGPLGNLRFHTPGPGGEGEVELNVAITIVRHQAKLEPPLRNLRTVTVSDTGTFGFSGPGVLTCVAEITIHGRTLQGEVLQAVGRQQVTFANFGGSAGQN